ncbi:hypothetical protein QJS04_geneDACA023285 [Acorus gramineus]|uniref:Myb/SANT-like domain-containing protein n=1 Tax=Acorus gramineus TaxID=55184 RepID=A0AAV9BPP2_ACOGR|nr:hypothetical protein QJS04_geneDACA023285 [Acorus gramineus]
MKGRRIDGGFTSTGWAEVVTAFLTKFPQLGLNKDKLRERLRTMKKKYLVVKEMMEQSGFGWNPTTNTIEVDKYVWEPYLEAHPGVGPYRYVQLIEYEKLQQIIGDTVAHGGGSRTINQLDTSTPVEVTNLDGSQSPMHQFGFGDDEMAESVSPKPPQTSDSRRRKSRSEGNSGRTPKSRRSATDEFFDADCLGAIDGTHISAWVPISDHGRFRNRKGSISQNVMAMVGFDMRFQYMLAGWEGSASYSKILYHTLSMQGDPLQVHEEKYYLVDAGCPNMKGFVAPFRARQFLDEVEEDGADNEMVDPHEIEHTTQ